MDVKYVTTVTSTDSTGKPVEAIPVRAWAAGETDNAGKPVGAIPVTISATGKPVRLVAGKTAQNSIGQWLDTMPISGEGAYILPTPVLLDALDGLGAGSVVNGLLAIDTVNKIQGTGAVQLISDGRAAPQLRKDFAAPITDPAAMGVVAFRYHMEADFNANVLKLQFGDATTIDTAGPTLTLGSNQPDVDDFYFAHISEWPAIGSTIPGALTRFRIEATANAPLAARTSCDALIRNAGGRPTIMLTGDDIPISQFDMAYPYMRDRRIPFHLNVPSANVGGSGKMSWANLIEMHNSGLVDIGPNNTVDDASIIGKHSTVAAAVADYQANRAAIIAGLGFTPRGIDCGCYSNGDYEVGGSVKSQVAAMTQTAGSDVVTFGAAPTRAVAQGDTLEVYGDLRGATVLAVTDTVTVQLSRQATTSQVKPAAFGDRSGEFYFPKYPNALGAAGAKMMRTTGYRPWLTRFGFANKRNLWHCGNSTSNTAGVFSTSMKPLIDQVVLRGATGCIYFHGWGTGAPLAWANDDGTQAKLTIDYLVTLRDQGKLDILTPESVYNSEVGKAFPTL